VIVRRRLLVTSAVLLGLTAVGVQLAVASADAASDPPLLVAWSRIGDITLGQSKARVESEYGSVGSGFHVLYRSGDIQQGYYRLHASRVIVTFHGSRVGELDFTTPYYRTKSGFGVGSTIPLGPCLRGATGRCQHRWHGFVFDAWNKGSLCHCWVKVGLGKESLSATTANFLKPWFFIYTRHGRVTEIYLALKFVD
jgi:hypothetical protein